VPGVVEWRYNLNYRGEIAANYFEKKKAVVVGSLPRGSSGLKRERICCGDVRIALQSLAGSATTDAGVVELARTEVNTVPNRTRHTTSKVIVTYVEIICDSHLRRRAKED
jgi:hypothetical protein